MISKQDLDQILSVVKSYVDSLFATFSDKQKGLVAFEQQNMQSFGGGREIDHITFRKFLERFAHLDEANYATDEDIDEMFAEEFPKNENQTSSHEGE